LSEQTIAKITIIKIIKRIIFIIVFY